MVVVFSLRLNGVGRHHERIKDQIKVLVKDVIKTRGKVFAEVIQVLVQALDWLCLSVVVVSVGGHGERRKERKRDKKSSNEAMKQWNANRDKRLL